MSKDRIKAGTDKAAKAIADLVKLFEAGGHELSNEESEAVFAYLHHTVHVVAEKSRTARDLSKAVSGGFDFTAPVAPAPQVSQPRVRLARDAVNAPPLPAPVTSDRTVAIEDDVDFIDAD